MIGGHRFAWSLASAAAVLGVALTMLICAPARWLSLMVDAATGGRLQLTAVTGTLWRGEGQLALLTEEGRPEGLVLPGSLRWEWHLAQWPWQLELDQRCCMPQPVKLTWRPGVTSQTVSLHAHHAAAPLAVWPLAWLNGLGTPFNTLKLTGDMALHAQALTWVWSGGSWQRQGEMHIDLLRVAARVSPLPELGAYQLNWQLDGQGRTEVAVHTLKGPLLIEGQGHWANRRFVFRGQASAAAKDEVSLSNLLNIIGQRQGPRSLISVG